MLLVLINDGNAVQFGYAPLLVLWRLWRVRKFAECREQHPKQSLAIGGDPDFRMIGVIDHALKLLARDPVPLLAVDADVVFYAHGMVTTMFGFAADGRIRPMLGMPKKLQKRLWKLIIVGLNDP